MNDVIINDWLIHNVNIEDIINTIYNKLVDINDGILFQYGLSDKTLNQVREIINMLNHINKI